MAIMYVYKFHLVLNEVIFPPTQRDRFSFFSFLCAERESEEKKQMKR